MFESRFKVMWVPTMFLALLVLGACSGEIPPELLAAVASIEDSDLEELQIDLEALDEELEFIGEVQFISDTEWTIANLGFVVDPSTEIKGNLSLGDLAKVHASLTAEGALLVREIELALDEDLDDDDMDDDQDFKLIGLVEEVGEEFWAVDGVEIQITVDTEIQDEIKVGDLVEVYFFTSEEGISIAREIELEDESEDDPDDDDLFDDDGLDLDDDDEADDDHEESDSDDDDDDHSDSDSDDDD